MHSKKLAVTSPCMTSEDSSHKTWEIRGSTRVKWPIRRSEIHRLFPLTSMWASVVQDGCGHGWVRLVRSGWVSVVGGLGYMAYINYVISQCLYSLPFLPSPPLHSPLSPVAPIISFPMGVQCYNISSTTPNDIACSAEGTPLGSPTWSCGVVILLDSWQVASARRHSAPQFHSSSETVGVCLSVWLSTQRELRGGRHSPSSCKVRHGLMGTGVQGKGSLGGLLCTWTLHCMCLVSPKSSLSLQSTALAGVQIHFLIHRSEK